MEEPLGTGPSGPHGRMPISFRKNAACRTARSRIRCLGKRRFSCARLVQRRQVGLMRSMTLAHRGTPQEPLTRKPPLSTTTLAAPSEFTLVRPRSDRMRGPVRWIWSHAARYWPILVVLVLGAIGNAALAAAVPVLVGNAFNDMLKPNPVLSSLIPLALLLGGSQILRAVLQFGRNFGAELMAQRDGGANPCT